MLRVFFTLTLIFAATNSSASVITALDLTGPAGSTISVNNQGWQEVSSPIVGGGFQGTYLRTDGVETLNVTFSNLTQHSAVNVGLLVAQLQSLDPVRDGDDFSISIDGQEVLRVGLGFGSAPPYFDPVVSGYTVNGVSADNQLVHDVNTWINPGGFVDHAYNFGLLDSLQNITHTDSSLTLTITGRGAQGWGNEAYAIDNLSLSLVSVPAPSSLGIVLIALLGSAIRKNVFNR